MIATLNELLAKRAEEKPDAIAFRFLPDAETEPETLTFAQAYEQAQSIATYLRTVAAPGSRVICLFDSGLDFVRAFFGCLYGGFVAVPLHPPQKFSLAHNLEHIATVARDCGASIIVTNDTYATQRHLLDEYFPNGRAPLWLSMADVPLDDADGRGSDSRGDTIAFLQYTSGSTSAPKGVMVSHRNLIDNLQAISTNGLDGQMEISFASWLPTYHDLGLIGGLLNALYHRGDMTFMSPRRFLLRPTRWLQMIHDYRVTCSGAPNFAFDLTRQSVSEQFLENIDLSCWTTAFIAAEPIRAATIDRFADRFASAGFDKSAFLPCYGLAETTLLVACGPIAGPPITHRFDDDTMVESQAELGSSKAPLRIASGLLPDCTTVRIVDPSTSTPVVPGCEGEIWVQSSSVTQGYWKNPEQTDAVFRAKIEGVGESEDDSYWLRTGDLGRYVDGALYITGRLKEIIISAGRCIHPHDIEAAVQQLDKALKLNGGAVFAIESSDREQVVLVQETRAISDEKSLALRDLIAAKILELFGLKIDRIVFVKNGKVFKTPNGKIQRVRCRDAYLAGEYVDETVS